MNSLPRRRVEPGICRSKATLVWCAWATVVCLGVHGCTEANGGAVELSWALRSTRDVEITDCASGEIGRIRLWWQTGNTSRFTAFPCKQNHGVTAFDLPVGPVSLWVAPECAPTNGRDEGIQPPPEMYVTPPPIVRDVAVGEAVTLDAVLLVVKIDDCTATTCICGRPCDCAQATASGPPLATDQGTKHPDPRGEEP
jgi:hypothetical protein